MTVQTPSPDAAVSTRREALMRERAAGMRPVLPRRVAVHARPAASRSGLGGFRTVGARILTIAAMGFVALLTVGMSIPASAFGTASGEAGVAAAARQAQDAQQLSVAADATGVAIARDGYQVTTAATYRAAAEAAAAAAARAQAAANAAQAAAAKKRGGFNPAGTGPVRWPFPSSVPLGPGFGAPSTCRGCQAVHQGQDFLAADGSAIYAIAAGVVTAHDESGSLGNHLTITHTVDGHTVTSLYGHMASGSSPLKVGDRVAVGQFVGSVGQTGAATAPHLHLEVTVDGAHVDPYAWLQAHAG